MSRYTGNELTNQRSQAAFSSARENRIRSNSHSGETDHEIIFGAPVPSQLRNMSRFRSTTPPTPPTLTAEQMAEQLRYATLEAEYERRAWERRAALDSLSNFEHMPSRLYTNNGVAGGIRNERQTNFSLNPSAIASYEASAPLDPIFSASIGATAPPETTFENNDSCSSPAPRYTSEDEELPSYEAATSNSNKE